MNADGDEASAVQSGSRRLSKPQRRQQLLEKARMIARDEGADRLTLGHLAVCAGVSKPVVYDHFPTRSSLLIELYRWMDLEQVKAFQDAMAAGGHGPEDTFGMLASAYIHCAADMKGEVYAIGAALAGSEEKTAVLRELLDNCVQMFVAVLQPHSALTLDELQRRCLGLVGAGEALAAAVVRGSTTEAQACEAFKPLIRASCICSEHRG